MKAASMEALRQTSELDGANAAYLEALYEAYCEDPESVSEQWQTYFAELKQNEDEANHSAIRAAYVYKAYSQGDAEGTVSSCAVKKFSSVMDLIYGFRCVGHQHAKIDPLGLLESLPTPELSPFYYGLSDQDLAQHYDIPDLAHWNLKNFSEELEQLRTIYCGSIGYEYMHINNTAEKLWVRERIESLEQTKPLSVDKKKWVLERLSAAEGLEKYMGMKYVGQKRFSLEGGESLIPMLDEIIHTAGNCGAQEIAIAMAHRGRLNVLTNIMGKAPQQLFREFEGEQDKDLLSGDVKYHNGYSSDVRTEGGVIHLTLGFNPSHLEIVSPVSEGSVRARQDRRQPDGRKQVLAVQIHGDSAFSGQGVVMETLNMSLTRGYGTGGSIHIVVNNQVGFTTNHPEDLRSTYYCTDIGKMIEVPIFHVNGDDPEAVVRVAKLAMEYRDTFHKNVVIDLVCYRRHGHNESDEPSGTQPVMYQVISKLPTTRKLYADRLVQEGVITTADAQQYVKDIKHSLENDPSMVKNLVSATEFDDKYIVNWKPYLKKGWREGYDHKVTKKHFKALAKKMETFPDWLVMQKQVEKTYMGRADMTAEKQPINWGYAELMAYATLLDAGYPVRLSGEDCGRGTFSHRHSVLHSMPEGRRYIPLNHLSKKQATFTVIDSILSEEAVLAFEYGYAASSPETLVIWEAQFGDFVNTAQVVIDQFISSGEEKWGRLGGVTLFLPHGYEGMGAEHSSARLERFLQLCAHENMQVCVPTTPAQAYHMIRRQSLRPYRKPLIVMTPKSLLRSPMAVSTLDDCCNGQFQVVIPEGDDLPTKKVDRLVFCQGKVYYDLLKARREKKIKHIALVRIEQLYPFPDKEIRLELKKYAHVEDIVWCQEEPRNQGAWHFMRDHLPEYLSAKQTLRYVGRIAMAAPAVGYPALHVEQQTSLVEEALSKKRKK